MDLSKLKKAELIELAEKHGLLTDGTKADIIARLDEVENLLDQAEDIVEEIDDTVDEVLEKAEELTKGTRLGDALAWLNDRPQVKRMALLGLVAIALATGLYATTL